MAAQSAHSRLGDSSPPRIRGNLDRVSPDGILFGWCLDQADPADRAEVAIRAGGQEIGRTRANSFRQDLADAGLGDGQHGFAFTLPMSVLRQARSCAITALHAATGTPLGDGLTWRSEEGTGFDDRLARLEDDLAVIRQRLDVSVGGDTAIAGLFAAVGEVFARLGRDLRDGRSDGAGLPPPGPLDVLHGQANQPAQLALPFATSPQVAVILVAGDAGMEVLHATLAQLADSRFARRADVFLLDGGVQAGACLLPARVRNLRYLAADDAIVSTCDTLIRELTHPAILLLDAALPVSAAWLDDLAQALPGETGAGAAGLACVVVPPPFDAAALAGMPASMRALDDGALLLWRAAYEMAGGLDRDHDTLGAAVVDLCWRLQGSGWRTDLLGGLALRRPGAPVASPRALALLDQAWPGRRLRAQGTPMALVLADGDDPTLLGALLQRVRASGGVPIVLALLPRAASALYAPALLRIGADVIWVADGTADGAVLDGAAGVLARVAPLVRLVCVGASEAIPAMRAALAQPGPAGAGLATADVRTWQDVQQALEAGGPIR